MESTIIGPIICYTVTVMRETLLLWLTAAYCGSSKPARVRAHNVEGGRVQCE